MDDIRWDMRESGLEELEWKNRDKWGEGRRIKCFKKRERSSEMNKNTTKVRQ